MSTQPSLFDPVESKRLRDEAIEQVDAHADDEWKESCDDAIDYAALTYSRFWSDHVWQVLDGWGVPRPREPRALGPRMQAAVKRKVMVPTSDFQPSARPEHHTFPCRVYRSLIMKGQK